MKILASLFLILLGIFSSPQANAEEPLQILPQGMMHCKKKLPCISLLIRNVGNSSISFGANGSHTPEIPYPSVRYFSNSNGNWVEFGQTLGEFMAPHGVVTIRPGETKHLYVVIKDIPPGTTTLRVSIQDKSGVFHDSNLFDRNGADVTTKR